MLELDADKRITAEQILAHPYLAQVYTNHPKLTFTKLVG